MTDPDAAWLRAELEELGILDLTNVRALAAFRTAIFMEAAGRGVDLESLNLYPDDDLPPAA